MFVIRRLWYTANGGNCKMAERYSFVCCYYEGIVTNFTGRFLGRYSGVLALRNEQTLYSLPWSVSCGNFAYWSLHTYVTEMKKAFPIVSDIFVTPFKQILAQKLQLFSGYMGQIKMSSFAVFVYLWIGSMKWLKMPVTKLKSGHCTGLRVQLWCCKAVASVTC